MSKKATQFYTPPLHNIKIMITHHDNGEIESKIPYVNDEQHGVETWWLDNGQKESETTWVNGKQHGVRTWWNENGQKAWERYYVHDAHLALIKWDYRRNVINVKVSTMELIEAKIKANTTIINTIGKPKKTIITGLNKLVSV